jgi:hypothetical protein
LREQASDKEDAQELKGGSSQVLCHVFFSSGARIEVQFEIIHIHQRKSPC